MPNYLNITDEQLIRQLRDGESQIMDFLLEKYKPLVRRRARMLFLNGGEQEDLIQEGMIGLFKAINDFDLEQTNSFASFAKLCISRQMNTAITASNRKKHQPLNYYVSLYAEAEEDSALIDSIEAQEDFNPETLFLGKEYTMQMQEQLLKELSSLEQKVLYLHLTGMDYRAIAVILGKNDKTIDNAIQRIRKKAGKIIK